MRMRQAETSLHVQVTDGPAGQTSPHVHRCTYKADRQGALVLPVQFILFATNPANLSRQPDIPRAGGDWVSWQDLHASSLRGCIYQTWSMNAGSSRNQPRIRMQQAAR